MADDDRMLTLAEACWARPGVHLDTPVTRVAAGRRTAVLRGVDDPAAAAELALPKSALAVHDDGVTDDGRS